MIFIPHVCKNRMQTTVIGLLPSGLSLMICAVTTAIKFCTEGIKLVVSLQGKMSKLFSGVERSDRASHPHVSPTQ